MSESFREIELLYILMLRVQLILFLFKRKIKMDSSALWTGALSSVRGTYLIAGSA